MARVRLSDNATGFFLLVLVIFEVTVGLVDGGAGGGWIKRGDASLDQSRDFGRDALAKMIGPGRRGVKCCVAKRFDERWYDGDEWRRVLERAKCGGMIVAQPPTTGVAESEV